MENNKTEQLEMKLRRSLRGTAAAMMICATGFIRVIDRSNVRAVDVLSLMASGIAIGAFLVTVIVTYKVKKMNSTK